MFLKHDRYSSFGNEAGREEHFKYGRPYNPQGIAFRIIITGSTILLQQVWVCLYQ